LGTFPLPIIRIEQADCSPELAYFGITLQVGIYMKVSLVVASGAHQGKVIAITGPQFLIGRDAQCHLRPASQAISKHHCGVMVRDGQVYVKDLGSTNGTLVNDVLIKAEEVLVANGSNLKIGPLDFTIRIELPSPKPDGTPLPADTPETSAALAAVKAATSAVANKGAPTRDATPNPAKKAAKPTTPTSAKEGSVSSGSKEAAALKTPPQKSDGSSESLSLSSNLTHNEDDDKMAAMLLNMEDEKVPDGSTVVELPAVDAQGKPIQPTEAAKPKQAQTREEMSSAASDLLRKMMRRPK
jgi:pSer/pThr/pTyr-binding forkhead associated (FHA) protein